MSRTIQDGLDSTQIDAVLRFFMYRVKPEERQLLMQEHPVAYAKLCGVSSNSEALSFMKHQILLAVQGCLKSTDK